MAALVRRGERGSAVAEFVMVSGLVVFLFMAVLQLGLVLHIRNTLISCASEGARLGARADAEPGMGAVRARELITASLADDYAEHVTVGTGLVGGVQVVEVRVRAPFPVLGLIGPDGQLDISGRAFLERQ
ncbi:pilus biosynthesis protein TadE [Knoellia sinensis KCTC 19936]|uniref:Pilus biosynthesis protein TadE n=1 Tax=Knoellia sinensis KCTC 19936 TaxID=1385520 RepID=A0A0A0JGT8_9MICO|nr:TadE family protein [Knoellia sinensis]KGN34841.1 pilus biosynthesis protein TadE [Knoellia sinensis KCTC 19936]